MPPPTPVTTAFIALASARLRGEADRARGVDRAPPCSLDDLALSSDRIGSPRVPAGRALVGRRDDGGQAEEARGSGAARAGRADIGRRPLAELGASAKAGALPSRAVSELRGECRAELLGAVEDDQRGLLGGGTG